VNERTLVTGGHPRRTTAFGIAKLTRAWYNQGVSRVCTQARNRLNR